MRLDQSVPNLVNDAYLIHHRCRGKDYALEQQKRNMGLGFAKTGEGTPAHMKVRNEWAIVDAVEAGVIIDIVAKLRPVERAWAEWAYVDENAGYGANTINALYQDYVIAALNHWGESKREKDSQSVLRVVTNTLKSYRFSIFSGTRHSVRQIATTSSVKADNAARDWSGWVDWAYSYADDLDKNTRVHFRNLYDIQDQEAA
jgi:hypothetical protein